MECDSVARDALALGVFIALVAEIFCVDVAASTLSGVVWVAERDEEMAEGADITKGWLDEPAKSWAEILKIALLWLTILYVHQVRKCIVNVLATNDAKNYHSF